MAKKVVLREDRTKITSGDMVNAIIGVRLASRMRSLACYLGASQLGSGSIL